MCEQTGQEIDWEKCPPEMQDFPDIIITAIEIYNNLGDRVYPDIGFIGKDFTNLSIMFELHYIIEEEKDYLMELLLLLDTEQIKQSQEQLKAQYNKIKK